MSSTPRTSPLSRKNTTLLIQISFSTTQKNLTIKNILSEWLINFIIVFSIILGIFRLSVYNLDEKTTTQMQKVYSSIKIAYYLR